MRRPSFITVFVGVLVVGVLVVSVGAMAAIRVSVTPLKGTPKTKFTVSFVVDRKVTGYRYLIVRATGPGLGPKVGCEYQETADVTYAPKGQRVNVVLQPLDMGRWCPGVYSGDINVEYRTPCEGGVGATKRDTEGPCSTQDVYDSTVARFRFTVTR